MIIIVLGLPGTGKTTFAKALASRLGATHINSDQVRHESRKRGQYDSTTKHKIYEEMLALAEEALEAADSVVLDATFYKHAIRQMTLQHMRNKGKGIHFINVTAPEALIKQRLQGRRKYSEADYDVYLKVKEEFDPIEYEHLTLDSSAHDLEEMVDASVAYIQVRPEA